MKKRLTTNAYALIAGQSISTFGDYVARTALSLFILDKTGSAFNVGIMLIMNSFPAILGISSTYFSRKFMLKNLLIVYSIFSAGFSFCMTLVTSNISNLFGIYVIYFLLALMNSFYTPTRLGLMSEIIDENELRAFNSIDQTMEAVMMSLGIAAAGYLYLFSGINLIFIINSLSFIVIIIIIFFAVKPFEAENCSSINGIQIKNSNNTKGIFETFKTVRLRKDLFFLTSGVGFSGFAVGIFSTMFIVFIRKDLQGTAQLFSQVFSFRTLISSIVGFSLSLVLSKISEKAMVVFGYLAMGIGIIAMTFNFNIFWIFIWNIIIGAANMFYYIAVRTLLQKNSDLPKTELFALQSAIMRFTMVLASGVSGILVDSLQITATWQLRVAGVIFVLIGIWGHIVLKINDISINRNSSM